MERRGTARGRVGLHHVGHSSIIRIMITPPIIRMKLLSVMIPRMIVIRRRAGVFIVKNLPLKFFLLTRHLPSLLATVLALGYRVPWTVYEPNTPADLIPFVFVSTLAFFLVSQFLIPGLMIVIMCGCLPLLPCCAPIILIFFRQMILDPNFRAGDTGEHRRRVTQEIMDRCTCWKLDNEEELESCVSRARGPCRLVVWSVWEVVFYSSSSRDPHIHAVDMSAVP